MTDLVDIPAHGVSGWVNGVQYFIGSPTAIQHRWTVKFSPAETERLESVLMSTSNSVVVLANADGPLAAIELSDCVRAGATKLVGYLQARDIECGICSGDREETVINIAPAARYPACRSGMPAAQKLAVLDRLIDQGKIVAMVGDGINDTPALNRAHLGIAVARNVNLAAANADVIVNSPRLDALQSAHVIARKTSRIIRQNLGWGARLQPGRGAGCGCRSGATVAGWNWYVPQFCYRRAQCRQIESGNRH